MDRKQYIREYANAWRKKNRDKVRKWGREYYHRTRTKETLAKKVAYNKEHRFRVKVQAIEKYGGKCACCGEVEIKFLCIDHINGGGNQHRKQLKTRTIGEWLKANGYPDGFQVLCHNCNMAKSIYGKCPHKTA